MKEIIINILSKVYQRRYEVLKGETPSNKNPITPTKQKSNGGFTPTKQKSNGGFTPTKQKFV